jgi:CRP-like cAMP-binding protein
MLFPTDDLVLPSLWEAVSGRQDVDWSIRDDEDRFVAFTPEMERVWSWKDELPEHKLVCAGKHLGGRASLVSLGLLPVLYALTGRTGRTEDFRDEELSPVERDVAEALLEAGPTSSTELPSLAGHERKRVSSATARLQKRLILTAAGRQEHDQGWPSVVFDLLPRRYGDRLETLPHPDESRATLALTILRSAGEVSAADVAAVIGGTRKQAAAALERLTADGKARQRDAGEYLLWTL